MCHTCYQLQQSKRKCYLFLLSADLLFKMIQFLMTENHHKKAAREFFAIAHLCQASQKIFTHSLFPTWIKSHTFRMVRKSFLENRDKGIRHLHLICSSRNQPNFAQQMTQLQSLKIHHVMPYNDIVSSLPSSLQSLDVTFNGLPNFQFPPFLKYLSIRQINESGMDLVNLDLTSYSHLAQLRLKHWCNHCISIELPQSTSSLILKECNGLTLLHSTFHFITSLNLPVLCCDDLTSIFPQVKCLVLTSESVCGGRKTYFSLPYFFPKLKRITLENVTNIPTLEGEYLKHVVIHYKIRDYRIPIPFGHAPQLKTIL